MSAAELNALAFELFLGGLPWVLVLGVVIGVAAGLRRPVAQAGTQAPRRPIAARLSVPGLQAPGCDELRTRRVLSAFGLDSRRMSDIQVFPAAGLRLEQLPHGIGGLVEGCHGLGSGLGPELAEFVLGGRTLPDGAQLWFCLEVSESPRVVAFCHA